MSPRRRPARPSGNSGVRARQVGDRTGQRVARDAVSAAPARREARRPTRSGSLDRKVLAGNRALRKILQPALSGAAAVQRVGTLVNFHTLSIGDGAATLKHEVGCESDTGNLQDLDHVKTREHIEWGGAPAEFCPDAVYAADGEHFGRGDAFGSTGKGEDNHDVFPKSFKLGQVSNSFTEDGTSPNWVMTQHYQMKVGEADWQDIPGAAYQITRWLERRGDTLIAYVAKRGLGESVMHRSLISLDNFFG